MARHEWRVTYRRKDNRYPQFKIFGLWPKAKGFMDGLLEPSAITDLPVIEIVVAKRMVGRWENVRRWTPDGADTGPVPVPGVPGTGRVMDLRSVPDFK